MDHEIVELEGYPDAVREFFENLRDKPVLIRSQRKAIGVFYPAVHPVYVGAVHGKLEDVAGGWDDLPDEVEQIGR